MAKKRPLAATVWQGVRLLRAFDAGAPQKRSKRFYSVALDGDGSVSLRSGGSQLALAARDVGSHVGTRVCLGGEPRRALDFATASDAANFVDAVTESFAWRPRPESALLDLQDPAVRAYVASLLVDPNFATLVKDLGDVYASMRQVTAPSARPDAP